MPDYGIHCAALSMMEEHRSLDLRGFTLENEDLLCSPQFMKLAEMLPRLAKEGHRVLLFSQWTQILDLLEGLVEYLDMGYLRLDGATAINERQGLIDTFNDDPSIPIFLLSTRAGGMGINLTAADTVIIHDLDFNPINDIQAEDRCHRIGQTRPVTVYKMVTANTVDKSIYDMQNRKKTMNAAILMEGENGEDLGDKAKGGKKDDSKETSEMLSNTIAQFLQGRVLYN